MVPPERTLPGPLHQRLLDGRPSPPGRTPSGTQPTVTAQKPAYTSLRGEKFFTSLTAVTRMDRRLGGRPPPAPSLAQRSAASFAAPGSQGSPPQRARQVSAATTSRPGLC